MFVYFDYKVICRLFALKLSHFHVADRTKPSGGQNVRDKATIKRLQMYRNFKAKRLFDANKSSRTHYTGVIFSYVSMQESHRENY